MNNSQKSGQLQTFYAYIFGDYRNYYFDGIPEDVFKNLSADEKRQAEDMLLNALDEEGNNERVIEAVGQFRIIQALPVLRNLYSEKNAISTRLHVAWALYRILGDPQYVDIFVKFIKETSDERQNLARENAILRLSEFGKNPKSVELLFELEDVRGIARVFKGNPLISKMLNVNNPSETRKNWKNISKEVRIVLEKELRKL